MEFYEKLYQAIKNDDIKEFEGCMETNYCGSLRLGRFPVLSIMYLYNSRRLLRTYEKKFLKHNSWQDVGEPIELAAKFRGVAGKCLRLYLNETVSPLEMLLLLNRDFKLKRVFSQAHITAPVKQRLKDIYYVRWGLNADFVRGKIVLERRPLTRVEKLRWMTRAVCMVLCLAVFAATPFVINAFVPFITDELGVLNVSSWSQINFNSDKIYALKGDVTVPENFFAKEMNCELRGNGHTVTVKGDSLFGNINGNISDVTFETDGSPIAETVNWGSKVAGVTVNAVVKMEIDTAIGFFAVNNYSATVSDVTVNVSGALTAIEAKQIEEEEEVAFNSGGIVATNHASDDGKRLGTLQNCSVNYVDFSLKGQLEANAAFGGIAGVNDGVLRGCQTGGTVTADTLDVAGICVENYHWVDTSESRININQSTAVSGWNPLAAGIVLFNYFVVDHCVNRGDIISLSTASMLDDDEGAPYAYAAGIAYRSVGNAYLQFCENYGKISASATQIAASASGVCYYSNGLVILCVNNGEISADSSTHVEVAGITSLSYGYVRRCINNGAVVATSDYDAYVGGIVGQSCYVTAECLSYGSIEVNSNYSFVGGILGCSIIYVGVHSAVCGTVMSCVADCEITVESGRQLDVGGIVGLVMEKLNDDIYTFAQITDCYFIGEFNVAAKANLGAIAGVVGVNTYRASESAEKESDKNFFGNYYAQESGVEVAYGVAIDENDDYVAVGGLGSESAPLSQILSDEKYLQILKNAVSED